MKLTQGVRSIVFLSFLIASVTRGEIADAIYRDGVFFNINYHAALKYRFDNANVVYYVVHSAGGSSYEPNSVRIGTWADFLSGNTWVGWRCPANFSGTLRSWIISDALDQLNAHYWGYGPFTYCWKRPNTVSQNGDGCFRCDGLVEWGYEYNGYDVCNDVLLFDPIGGGPSYQMSRMATAVQTPPTSVAMTYPSSTDPNNPTLSSSSSITLRASASDTHSGLSYNKPFDYYYSKYENGTWGSWVYLASDGGTRNQTILSANTLYAWYVEAFDNDGNSTVSPVYYFKWTSTVAVTVQANPSGRSFSVDGTTYTSSQTFNWTPGSSHTIATTSTQSGSTGVQYVWSSWSDGGAMSHTVSPASGTTYTANFTTQYYLTMNAGTGSTVSPSSGWRNSGASVSISTTPNSGYSFSSWAGSGSGSYSGSSSSSSVTMNAPITETASFTQNPISITVQPSPSGRSFTVDGTSYTTAQTFSWTPGSSHTIAASSPQSGGTGIQYVWSSWSDGGAISHTVAPTSGTTYTATFATQYYLTMNAGTGGTVSPSSGWRNSGASVSIGTTPNSGYSFSSWAGSGSGSYSGSSSSSSVTMNAPITETASFTQNPISITVQPSPSGRSFTVDGTSYTTVQTFSWTPGSSHTIATTTPQSGGTGVQYVWSSWSDGGAMSHTVAPTGGTTYTANFTTQYYLTMSAGTGGTVTPSSGWYNSSAGVSISTTPNSGYSFSIWTGSGSGSYSGSSSSSSVTMNAAITETAAFVSSTLPQLGSSRQGINFVLSWPTNDPAFKLFYATNLPATTWISNPVAPAIVSGQYTITNGMTNNARFYRLKK